MCLKEGGELHKCELMIVTLKEALCATVRGGLCEEVAGLWY